MSWQNGSCPLKRHGVIAMTYDATALPVAGGEALTGMEADALRFVAEMYAVQLDQLAALLADWGVPAEAAPERAREAVTRWRSLGYVDRRRISPGLPWVWATRGVLEALGLYSRRGVEPSAHFLRHTHAVTEVRLAVQRTSAYQDGGASWRSERRIRARMGRPARDEHIPDAEVRWPADRSLPGAGEVSVVEVELSRKPFARIVAIMTETLTRTGDYGCPLSIMAVPGLPPRCERMIYTCSSASVRTVLRARAQLASPLAERVEVYDLPESMALFNAPKRGW